MYRYSMKVESAGEVFFYRDVTIEDVRELRFADPEAAGTGQEKLSRRGLEKFLSSLASQESFSEVLPKIEALKPGCEWLDAVDNLDLLIRSQRRIEFRVTDRAMLWVFDLVGKATALFRWSNHGRALRPNTRARRAGSNRHKKRGR